MRTDQADICARPQSASLASPGLEGAAEREWARLERILSGDSGAGSTGRSGRLRYFARPKRKVATFGFLGSLGAVSAFAATLVVPSLGDATQDNVAGPPVATAVATQPLPIVASPTPDVQSGRSMAVAETPPTSSPIDAPRIKPRPVPPTKERRATSATTTQRPKQARNVGPTIKQRDAAIRPLGRNEDRWYRVPAWRYESWRHQTWRY